jgi:hypothetical protein
MTRRATLLDTPCLVTLTRYGANGGRNVAILLTVDDETREPYDTVTTWIPGLAADEVAIRDDEIPGRAESMIKAELIFPQVLRRALSGWITIPVYRLVPGVAEAAK